MVVVQFRRYCGVSMLNCNMAVVVAEITTDERHELVTMLVGGLVVLIALGMWLLTVIGKSSPRRRLQGRYVLAYMASGYALGIIYWLVFQRDFHYSDEVMGVPLIGMLAGCAIGMIHGVLAVWWLFRRKDDSNQPRDQQ